METTILLVDDNPNVISFVQPALEQEGYRVATASDGLEALYQTETLAPALIILDIEMPDGPCARNWNPAPGRSAIF